MFLYKKKQKKSQFISAWILLLRYLQIFYSKILGCRDPRYKHEEQQWFEYMWIQKMNEMNKMNKMNKMNGMNEMF